MSLQSSWGEPKQLSTLLRLMAQSAAWGFTEQERAALTLAGDGLDRVLERRPKVIIVVGEGADPVAEAIVELADDLRVMSEALDQTRYGVSELADRVGKLGE